MTALLTALCSCTAAKDPFDADTTENINAETEYPGDEKPDPAFYSLTSEESFAAYGLPASSTLNEDVCDGRYIYSAPPTIGAGTAATVTRREYPDGTEWEPVCSDPLCTHTEESGCPLAKCKMFYFVLFENKIFFRTNERNESEELYIYDPAANKSTLILDGFYNGSFVSYGGGKLYFRYKLEEKDLTSLTVYCRLYGDGSTENIGELNEYYNIGDPVIYNDRYVTDYKFEKIDGDFKACLYLRDLKDEGVKEIFSKSYPDLLGKNYVQNRFNTLMLYDDELLIQIEYSVIGPEPVYGMEYHLIDLTNGNDRLVLFTDDGENGAFYCIYSEKTIICKDTKDENKDRFILNCFDPHTDKTESYDLTEAAKNAGFSMPGGCLLSSLSKGAVLMNKYFDYYRSNDSGEQISTPMICNFAEFDLKSGKIFKYRKPTQEELAEKYAAMYGM